MIAHFCMSWPVRLLQLMQVTKSSIPINSVSWTRLPLYRPHQTADLQRR
uniref:Uncharacterized protein n=1 Tax=Arundo donax TaxID=35708 RepID=A0A0A9CDJ6_ARUDO